MPPAGVATHRFATDLRSPCSPRQNRRFDLSIAVHHAAQNRLEIGEIGLPGNELMPVHRARAKQFDSLPAPCGGVMERGFHRDLGVVDTIRIQFDFCSGCASTEEVDPATFADHLDRPLPSEWLCHALDREVCTSSVRQPLHGFHRFWYIRGLHDMFCAEVLRSHNLLVAFYDS